MAQAIGTKMNEQQALGLDLNGNPGTAIFNIAAIPGGLPATTNTGASALSVSVQTAPSGTTSFIPSDYEFSFTTGTTGNITRLSDGVVTAFDFGATNPVKIDGLNITQSATPAAAGDRFMVKPFSASALNMTTAFSSPKGLAMASPAVAQAGIINTGTLAVAGLAVRSVPMPAAVTLTFTGPGTYTRSDTGATVYTYTPGVPIEYSAAVPPVTGWSLTLKGVAQTGDTYTVTANAFPMLDAGNAQAMLDLRDLAMFDGGPLTDGYASLMAEIGTRVQSAKSAATVSNNIATNVEKDRTSVSGVNLDEEAARMLQYQQAYQAAGRMMAVAQNIFDTLMQNLSR
jgi:flagellar hook-associated protein 1 FlgK